MTNILLISAQHEQRAVLSTMLVAQGYAVQARGESDVSAIEALPDLVLFDARGDFTTPVRVLRAALGDVPLLTLHAADAPPDEDADAHLSDPFDHAELLAMVAALLRVQATIVRLRQQHGALRARAERAEEQQHVLEVSDRKKDEFISFISHELKNPMASIKGYADLLRRRLGKMPDDPNLKGLDIISQQVVRMTTLLDQLLDFSRINMDRLQLRPARTDVNNLARRVVEDLVASNDQHQLKLDIAACPLVADVDTARLGQVISVLLDNAVKYSPEGSTIIVQTLALRNGYGQEAAIVVRDQGLGIPAEEQERLFEQFFRGSSAANGVSGLGLGLFIANGLVQRHGGQIEVESDVGRGSTFTVRLPLASEQERVA